MWAPTPIPASSITLGPVLVLALHEQLLLVICDDGQLRWTGSNDVRIDLRYDYRLGEWVDVSGFGEDDAASEEEATDDRGEEVPGDLPELD